MARVICEAVKKGEVKTRGRASIEWYDENDIPQYYCLGYNDASTDFPLSTCLNCRDYVGGDHCENDFKKYQLNKLKKRK